MSSDPSRPSIQCFPNLAAEKRVTANAIGNRSITVSIQGRPLCVYERQDRAEGGKKERKKRWISSFISNESLLFPSRGKDVIRLCLLAFSENRGKSSFTAHFGRCHVQKARNDPHLMSHSTEMQDRAGCVFVAWLSDCWHLTDKHH